MISQSSVVDVPQPTPYLSCMGIVTRTQLFFRMRFCLLSVLLLGISGISTAQPNQGARPSDNLLDRPSLQTLVERQIQRDGNALAKQLTAPNSEVRARAAFALASVQDTSAVPALRLLLRDGVPLVRTDAALALGQMAPEAVPADPLLQALAYERDAQVQRRLIEALGKTGDASSLQALLRINPPDARDADVALALARYGMRGIVDSIGTAWLTAHLTARDAPLRRTAAYAFGRVESLVEGHADSIRQALDRYASNDPAAMHLVRALGQVEDSADTGRLLHWLRAGEDERIRVNAARALEAYPENESVQTALTRALNDSHPHVARTAAETLAEASWTSDESSAVGAWMDAHPGRWRVIAPLLLGLARNGTTLRVLDTVERWQRERSVAAYAAALPGLAPLDTARADSLLVDALQSEDSRLAAAGLEGLLNRWNRLRPTQADWYFEQFSAAVRRGDPALLYPGASALTDSLFVERGAADTLAATYRSLSTPDDLEGMTAVLEALGAVGGSTAEPVLRDALDHSHHAVRQAAADAISSATDSSVSAASKPLPETPSFDWEYLQQLGPHPRLVLETNRGEVVVQLDTEQAPQTVQAITRFAREGRYDGVPFHRVVPNFVVQGGDFVRQDGFGGLESYLRTEVTRIPHRRGSIGMASAGKDTEGSQFFIPHSMQPHLDGHYTAFGRVVEGMEVVDELRVHDHIETATVEPDSNE